MMITITKAEISESNSKMGLLIQPAYTPLQTYSLEIIIWLTLTLTGSMSRQLTNDAPKNS